MKFIPFFLSALLTCTSAHEDVAPKLRINTKTGIVRSIGNQFTLLPRTKCAHMVMKIVIPTTNVVVNIVEMAYAMVMNVRVVIEVVDMAKMTVAKSVAVDHV